MATNVKINFITGSAAKVNLTSSNVIKATIKDRGPVGPIGLGITEQNIGFTLTGGITPKTLTVALDANVSGTNTGDETQSTIKTKLGVATASVDGYATATQITKLDGIAAGAEVNVQSDWTQATDTADDYIKNKPTLGTAAAKNIPATGNASVTEVVYGDDTRLTDARTPTSHSHAISDVTDLQTGLDGKVDENAAITGNTKTKITYDAKGLVTSGADATCDDITDGTNTHLVTTAEKTIIGNTSGTNSGDASGHEALAPIDNPTFTTGITTPAIKITTGASANKILTSDADGDATWEDPATSVSVTTKGDLQTFSTVPDRLPIGDDGKVLKANASTATGLEWGDAGTSSPLTTKGDLYGFDTVNQRIPIGTDGQVLTADSTDDQGLSWKNASATADVISEVPTGTPNGTLTDFTIIQSPITGTLRVFVNGVRQKVTDDYTFTGTTITFVSAPLTDSKILVDYKINSGDFSTGSASWINNETPSGTVDGSNQTFTLASTPVTGSLYLFRDGQLLTGGGADYTLTTNSIAFVTAPVTGSVLLAFYQSAVSTAGNADLLDGKHANELVPLTAKGDLETHDGSNPARLAVGTNGSKLVADSNQTTGLAYVAPDGWEPALQTWTRESDNSFSEPIDATLKYQKGDKIRYKQGAGYKHQYVVSVGAYSAGKTIITTTGGSDYVFTNGTAITDNYYSHIENPIGFPHWFNFTPVYSGTGGTAGTFAFTNTTSKFRISGITLEIAISHIITNKGSWSGVVQFTNPVPATVSSDCFLSGPGVSATNISPYPNSKGKAYPNGATIRFVSNAGVDVLQWAAIATNDNVSINGNYII